MNKNTTQMETKYEDSLFYQLNSNSRYFNLLFEQFFKELNLGISATEHLALSIISDTKDCCQRDLARLLVKDRANTGKIANTLEKKGYININICEKHKRPVKILTITEKGRKLCEEIMEIILPTINRVYDEIDRKTLEQAKETLKEFRKVVEKVVKVNI